jgi:hypothetical protein
MTLREQAKKHPVWLVTAIAGVCALVIAVLGLTGFSIQGQLESRDNAIKRACQGRNETRAAVVRVFELFEQSIYQDPRLTPKQAAATKALFLKAYAELAPTDCPE